MNLITYFAIVGFIALMSEVIFDNIVFTSAIGMCLGFIIGATFNQK